jgi:hypothetical protein
MCDFAPARGMAVLGVLAVLMSAPLVQAQEAVAEAALEQPAPRQDLLSPDELGKLLGPVALYPDSLLTQILMAATYPLDVVKAGRFVEANAAAPDKERAALVEQTGWDPSVQALAAGFPAIVTRMNDHLDWTEQVGDALLAQPDDVLDTVQRLRDEAAETGYLTTNDAQTVIVNADDTITIAPTNPQVVYVPAYDSNVVYTQPAPAANPVYVESGSGSDFTDALATGAIVFGSALVLNEIFEDDDPWEDYWRGPPPVNWSNNDFQARPRTEVNVDGDVNIGSNNSITGGDREFSNREISNRELTNIDRDTTRIDRDRTDVDQTRIGSLDREAIDRDRERSFDPDEAQRAEARDKIAARKAEGGPVATLPATTRPRTEGAQARVGEAKAAGQLKPATVNRPVKADRPAKVDRSAVSQRAQNVSRPQGTARPSAKPAANRTTAFEKSGGSRAKAASSRGKASVGKRRK